FTYTIADAAGATATATVRVRVSGVDDPPVAITALALPATTTEGAPVDLTGSFTGGAADDAHTVTIAWGDGTTGTLALAAGARTFAASHAYADDRAAAYTVSVTVNNLVTADVETASIVVTNVAPVVGVGDDAHVDEGA